MQDIFVKILSMGINASWIILAVMLFRLIFQKAPKWIICFLWVIAGFKLICPVDIESPISLIPVHTIVLPVNPDNVTIKNMDNPIQAQKDNKLPVKGTKSKSNNYKQPDAVNEKYNTTDNHVRPEAGITSIFTIIWVTGVIIMMSYLVINNINIHRKICTATHLSGNIWQSEFVDSPFILGLARPRIYIPYHTSKKQLAYILTHENAHLARKDHILKTIAFLVLSVYWFHPLVWLAYILLCRDIEFACDEKAVMLMDTQEKKEYLVTLLNCSTGKNNFNVSPLSFGETRIKERVIHVKKFKKPSFILTFAVFVTGIIISACFLSNPKEPKAEGNNEETGLASFYKAQKEPDAKDVIDAVLPSLTFDTEKKTFSFTYDVLSSYLPYGSYKEENNKIILNTDDGKFHYTFEKGSGNTLSFIADGSSPVTLTDSRFGMQIKNGMVFEPAATEKPDVYSAAVEARPASVDLKENTGADGVRLYYVDTEKIIFGGYFGLFVHDKASGQIIQSLDLEYIGCNHTQGDNYCSIAVSADGTKVYMKPRKKKKLYIFDTLYGTLEIRDCQKKYNIWDDSSLDLFHEDTTKYASYTSGTEKKTCQIYETNGIIGDCQYFEYTGKEPENKKEIVYHPLFPK